MLAILLIFSLLLSSILSTPLYNQRLSDGKNQREEESSTVQANRSSLKSVTAVEDPEFTGRSEQSKDLTGQETFYPIGGAWWGVRPWGGWGSWGGWGGWGGWNGWGGYRPWHGWHGPHWGGHWGGGRWGRP